MSEFTPTPDDSQRSEEEKREFKRQLAELQAQLTYQETFDAAMKEHIDHPYGSEWDLVNRLRIAQKLAQDKRSDEELSPLEAYQRPTRLKVVAQLDQMWAEAKGKVDVAFFKRLLKAATRVKKGDSQSIDTTGAIILAIDELRRQSGGCPTREQIQKLVHQWRHEGKAGGPLTEQYWDELLQDPFISALLRAC
jgi:hypothetical protein